MAKKKQTYNKVDMGNKYQKEILLRCDCAGYHFVEIYRDADWSDTTFITHIEQPKTLREKIQAIWNLLLKNESIYDSELLIRSDDLQRLADYFRDQAKRLPQQAAPKKPKYKDS